MATLEVLEETGLLFDDDEALEVLDGGGAIIDKKSNIVKFHNSSFFSAFDL